MKWNKKDPIQHKQCPSAIVTVLKVAGGTNPYGEPNFRLVWGYDRIVPIYGRWEEWEPAKLSGLVGTDGRPVAIPPRLKSSFVGTRQVPKYLPGNCWHLEGWCAPEMYGSPEKWHTLGREVIGFLTFDTAGLFPSRGEWEIAFSLTHDGTPQGFPIPIEDGGGIIESIVGMLNKSKDFSFAQRKAAIEQRIEREDKLAFNRMVDVLQDGIPAFHALENVSVQTGETKWPKQI